MNELCADYSIVIVTHSMQQAARVSHRTAYFYLGDLRLKSVKPSSCLQDRYIS
ncbi:hypothetical protein [Nitrosomonas aestuarii]|uniref:hypothetical protein n=1 Tax=Nitrosomonas aestuarii TaxID=52441 RepID=UPI001C631B5A